MIDNKELRRGNYVRCKDSYYRIENIVRDKVEFIGGGIVLQQFLEPIPLTPEILEKAGFKVGDGWRELQLYYDEYGSAYLYFNKGAVFLNQFYKTDAVQEDKVGFFNIHRPIQYLHQLQNLYFSLCNQELNITL